MSRWPGRLITKTPVTPGGSSPTASAPGVWTLPEMAYWRKQGLWPDASADAYWGYVSYLMATSSLSNANNNLFVDSSGAFSPVSRVGNTTQGSVTPYGTLWSVYLDGSGDYLSVPNNAAFSYGTGDFTMEAWVYKSGSGSMAVVDSYTAGSGGTFGFLVNDTQVVGYQTNVLAYTFTYTVPLNTWTHIAFTRTGGNLTCYVNGTSVGSQANSANFTSSNAIIIGRNAGSGGDQWLGYISNLRAVKGTAVYTGAFTPPTAPLTAVSGTSLLTCQSNRFLDASSNAFAVTRNGDVTVTPFSPFVLNAPGAVYNQSNISYWSGYFDGSGDYLSIPNNTAFDFGSGAMTLECWINTTQTTANACIYSKASSGYGTGTIIVSINDPAGAAGNVSIFQREFSASTPLLLSTGVVVNDGAWHHIAWVRDGSNNQYLYIDGVVRASRLSTALTITAITDAPRIGSDPNNSGRDWLGYISNFRIVKGTAVYTGAFTPPTAPLTAVSGTSLLTCQNAAFTDNSTNNFVITANGNATVTGNNPYQSGYYSNYFDGSGDYITAPANAAFDLGSGNFTLECWVYNNEVSRDVGYAGVWSTSYILYRQATVYRFYYFGPGGSPLTSSIPAVAGAWTHLAVVRNGSTLTFYVNGAVGATANVGTTAFNNGSTLPFHIGTNQDGPSIYGLNGYISNLRLVKGTAVYTAAFTPPTAPLTAISGTSLLTCQANRLIDNSSNAFTLTKFGDTAVAPFDPFYAATVASNGGSMYFDGTGDYLTLPSSDLYRVDLGDWTMEAWLYPTSTGVQHTVMSRGVYLSTYSFYFGTNGTSVYYEAGTGGWAATPYTSSSGAIIAGQWNHIAVVRSGTSLLMYANGNRVLNQASASFGANVTAPLWVGAYLSGSAVVNGNMTDVRFTQGTALYTGSTYTVPTAPLTPSANTTLLLNGMNAGEYDAAMQNNFETIGNAQASSVQAKYGPTSAYFSGAVDNYITAPNSPVFQFGTNDLTIEAWIYLTGDTITNPDGNRSATICSGIGATGVSNDFWFNVTGNSTTTGTGLNFQVFNGGSGTVIFNTTYSFSKSTWYHVAFTRSGNNVYLFVNGTVVGSTTYSGTITAGTNPLRVGYGQTGSINYRQPFPGYIDDLRITKGVARYTSNFTPPTAALPVY